MVSLTKSEAKKEIEVFFQKDSFSSTAMKKIKRLAMKHRIRLGAYRTRFCKKCYTDLKRGRVGVSKTHKTITCSSCNYKNKTRL